MALTLVSETLKQINDADISVQWSDPPNDAYPTIDLRLPDRCYLTSNRFINHKNDMRVCAGYLRVTHPELRGNGIGKRLLSSLGALATVYGYPKLTATINSQYSLDAVQQVFGESRLSYISVHAYDHPRPETPTSYEEARLLLEYFETLEFDRETRYKGITTHVDLSGLDVSGWELPQAKPGQAFDWDQLRAIPVQTLV